MMKIKKLLAVIMSVLLLATQFAFVGGVFASAEDAPAYTALTGRDDFTFGIDIHASHGFADYSETYTTLLDTVNTGAKAFRLGLSNPTDEGEYAYLGSIAEIGKSLGLDMTLNLSGFLNYFYSETTDEGGNVIKSAKTVDEVDYTAIKEYYGAMAERYKGKVSVYQLGNEMCTDYFLGGNYGLDYDAEKPNYLDLTSLAVGIQAATDAIKAADPDAKVLINIVWIRTGFIEGIKSVKLDKTTGMPATEETAAENIITPTWDYIGLDWYSKTSPDVINPDTNTAYDYKDVIAMLDDYEEDIIIQEGNIAPVDEAPETWSSENTLTTEYYGDAQWLEDFITYCYGVEKIKGFFVYELYDEPSRLGEDADGNAVYNRQAYYGLIDANGNKKDTYYVVQGLYGGNEQARVSEIPAAPTAELMGENLGTLYSGVKTGKVTRSFAEMFAVKDLDARLDYTEADFVEFDLYVEDASAFKAAADSVNYGLRMYLYNSDGQNRWAWYIPVKKITKDGWNHIVLSNNNFDQGTFSWENVNGFSLTFGSNKFYSLSNEFKNAASSGMKIAVSNVCATKLTRKTESTVGEVVASFKDTDASSTTWGNVNANIKDNYKRTAKTYAAEDFVNAEYLEFDVYVEDPTIFDNLPTADSAGTVAQATTLMLFVSDAGVSSGNYLRYDITDMITKSGWNHIVLKKCGKDANLSVAPTYLRGDATGTWNVKYYAVGITRNTTGNAFGAATYWSEYADFVAITDLIGSKKTTPTETVGVPIASLTGDTVYTAKGNGKMSYLGSRLNTDHASLQQTKPSVAVDFSQADYIEFDFFAENWYSYDALIREYAMEEQFTFHLSSSTEHVYNNYMFAEIYSQVKHSGWNHIIIDIDDFTHRSIDLSEVIGFKLTVGAGEVDPADISYTDTVDFSLANIKATRAIDVPDDIMAEHTNIGADGFNKVTLEDGFFDVLPEGETLDISGLRMIELDVFVENSAINELTLDFANADEECYGSYTFEGITVGWNHLAVRMSDFVDENGEFKLDCSNIVYVTFVGEGNAEFYTANFYAADYVDGDSNRDGNVNVLDLIRAKKVSVGSTNRGNIIAMDLADDDYVVGATDLSEMKKILLAK